MLSPGAMTTLRKLSIREFSRAHPDGMADFNCALEDTSSPHHTWAQELDQLGKVVFSLPRLVEVSGSCSLFSCAMAEKLRAWGTWVGQDSDGEPYQAWKKLE